MAVNEFLTEPGNIENSPKIPENLSINKVTRSFNEDNTYFIDFLCVANGDGLFFTQFYWKDDDPEICGYESLSLLFDVDGKCTVCKAKYVASNKKGDWLQCKLCEQWFHESCLRK